MLANLWFLIVLILLIPIIILTDIVTLGGRMDGCSHSYWWRHKKEMGKVFKKIF